VLRELKRRFREAGRWDPNAETVKIIKPRLAIEAVVSNGVVKTVRCKAEIDAGVETEFIGVAEEADARLEAETKPAEADKPHAKMAEELKAAYPRVEKIQPAEETKAASPRLEPAEAGYPAVGGIEKEEDGFEMGDASVDYGRFVEEGVWQFPSTWGWKTGFCTSNCSAA